MGELENGHFKRADVASYMVWSTSDSLPPRRWFNDLCDVSTVSERKGKALANC